MEWMRNCFVIYSRLYTNISFSSIYVLYYIKEILEQLKTDYGLLTVKISPDMGTAAIHLMIKSCAAN